jgi:hypothetical protein
MCMEIRRPHAMVLLLSIKLQRRVVSRGADYANVYHPLVDVIESLRCSAVPRSANDMLISVDNARVH